MPLTPKNRKEEWLEGLVEHETTLTPKNRCEAWMKEIIDASGSGGGGGGGVLVVGINMGTMTLDKTWKEIADAPFTIIKSPMSETANGYTLIFQTEAYNGTYSVLCAAFGVDGQGVVSLGQLIFETNSENGYPVLNMG